MGQRAVEYRRYPLEIKAEIVRTGLPNLFPQMNIPRTTAASWIANRRQIVAVADLNPAYEGKIKFLENELAKEKALRVLVETVRFIFPFDFALTRVKSKETKRKLVRAVEAATKFHQLQVCLQTIGITARVYYRWVTASKSCEITKAFCARKHPNQLTDLEIQKMKTYITSAEYSYVPIYSLCLLAQRNGDLFCSVDTWYKYRQLYSWMRPNKKIEEKRIDVGIRAKQPNEIWHVDITHIELGNGAKAYLQTVVDNYSRYLVSWRLTRTISSLNTVTNLRLAKENAFKEFERLSTNVMMDGGPENKAKKVLKFIESSNMKRVIARADIRFSNSMVEAFFRSLKNNFLYHQDFETLKDLERKLRFYFKQHNEVLPHSAFKGATPKEIFLGTWTEELQAQLRSERQMAVVARRQSKPEKFCGVCTDGIH